MRWMQHALAVASTAGLLGACALGGDPGDDSEPGDDLSTAGQAVASGTCSAVALTSPTSGFSVGVGTPVALTATSTCTATAEYQFWAKQSTAASWSTLGAYGPSTATWSIPTIGSWCFTVVVRTLGATSYQKRATAVCGSAIHINQNPVAAADAISTTENVAGTVDVLANDSDPDTDTLTVASFTQGAHGTVAFSGGVATYTPTTGFIGADSFTYTLGDGHGGSATGTVSVTVSDQAPVAVDDVLAGVAGQSTTVDVLANDSDPDSDTLSVTSFTQGAHGTVTFSGGVATYAAMAGYSGSDTFSYTIDDGHGMTDSATVTVSVTNPVPGCTIAISGPATGVFGDPIHLVATAMCNTGAVEVQWYHRINSAYVVVQPWSTSLTLDYPADLVGKTMFYAIARTQGTTRSQGTSNIQTVTVSDNAPLCTSVKVTAPTNNQQLQTGLAQTLTALAVCPDGSTAEYQFWVKPTTTSVWTILPGYTTGSSSWTPAVAGTWNVKAVARTTTSHVNYQVASPSVTVNVVAP